MDAKNKEKQQAMFQAYNLFRPIRDIKNNERIAELLKAVYNATATEPLSSTKIVLSSLISFYPDDFLVTDVIECHEEVDPLVCQEAYLFQEEAKQAMQSVGVDTPTFLLWQEKAHMTAFEENRSAAKDSLELGA